MKRLITLMLASVFVLGTVASAFAIHTQGRGGSGLDFNARGSWRVVGEIQDNWDFDNRNAEETYNVHMRARTWFDFTTADGVKAVLGTEIGDASFGGAALPLGGDQTNIIEVKHLYVQFPWPNSDVTISAGLQGIALPGYFSSPIFDDDVAALVVSSPLTDTVGLTLAWLRANNGIDGRLRPGTGAQREEFDIFAAIVPITLEGMSITPYGLYAFLGADLTASGDSENGWWAGVNAVFTTFDPIYFGFDLIYGKVEDDVNREGWFFDAAIGMPMDLFTPELFFVYASGDNSSAGKDKRMPSVSPDYTATTFLFDGTALLSGWALGDPASVALWAVGLSLKDISFVDRLTHTFRVMYAQGTSSNDAAYGAQLGTLGGEFFTKEDSLIEFNFDTRYQMFEQLAAIVELGYIIPNFDDARDDNAFKLAAGFVYNF